VKNLKSFTVRGSGRIPGKFYIDFAGNYKITEIAKLMGLEPNRLEDIYATYGAELDDAVGVWYFPSRQAALDALQEMDALFTTRKMGKIVVLTFEEMEYIRQALINEGSNIIHVRNDLKKGIFDKFNS